MRQIQFENKHPDELAVPDLYLNMKKRIPTLNGNILTVRTTDLGVSIADYALRAQDKFPMYMFNAGIEEPGLLRAIIRSRAPGDWPRRKHPDIRPVEQMRQAIEYLDTVGNPVEVFRANWTIDDPLNTNAVLFRRYMSELAHQGLDVVERQSTAALLTPTGKMMTLIGFVLGIGSVIDHGHVVEADFLRKVK
jgi:hypothetical protein